MEKNCAWLLLIVFERDLVGPNVTRTYGSALPNIPFFSSFFASWTRRWKTPAENVLKESEDCSEEDLDLSGDPVRSTDCREMREELTKSSYSVLV